MSIVVFDPDSTEDVDFADRMRHPAAADPAGGMWLSDTEPSFVDADALRKGRLAKLRTWMRDAGYGAVVLFDPYNQRYATGSRNMFGYFLRNSTRYFFIPTEGPIVLFEYPQSYHVSMVLDTIDEARPSKLVWSSVSGRDDETAGPFADEIVDLLKAHGGGSMKLGLDRCSHLQALALEKRGCDVRDCQGEILAVRAVKTPEEVKCLQVSMAGAEAAVAAVREAIKPGVSENDLFAIMYHEVIRQGGEFIETRLLTSGQRTNPWFNEASGRKLRPGELVALDTDTIGCYGYYSDFSRTFRCGPGQPDAVPEVALPHGPRPGAAQHLDREARHGVSRDRGEGLEDPRPLHRPALYVGHARRRHAWRDAVHRAFHGLRGLWARWTYRAGHGGERRELYRREGRPRGRQARGRDPDHRDGHRIAFALSLRGRLS